MIRYSAWHESESGYETAEECQAWIDRQPNPEEYYVVATTDSFTPSPLAEKVRRECEDRKITEAVKREQDRIMATIRSLLLDV